MGTIKLSGVELSYREQGSGPTVLLIHGNCSTSGVWDEVLEPLAESAHVITYDRRSFGESRATPLPPAGYYAAHAEDAADLLQALETEPAVVVGWSAGGLIALHLALSHSTLVERLVLIEPPLHVKKHPTLPMLKAFATLGVQRSFGDTRAAARTFLRWATGYTTGGSGFDSLDEATRQAMIDQSDAAMAELEAGSGEELTEARLSAIGCPVTCLTGSLTSKAIASAAARLSRLMPSTKTETIQGAGHLLHVDQPTAFVDAVRRALPGTVGSDHRRLAQELGTASHPGP